jgi:hypothetical protein
MFILITQFVIYLFQRYALKIIVKLYGESS